MEFCQFTGEHVSAGLGPLEGRYCPACGWDAEPEEIERNEGRCDPCVKEDRASPVRGPRP